MFGRFIYTISHKGVCLFSVLDHIWLLNTPETWLTDTWIVSPLRLSQMVRTGAFWCSCTSSCHACAPFCWAYIQEGNCPGYAHVVLKDNTNLCFQKGGISHTPASVRSESPFLYILTKAWCTQSNLSYSRGWIGQFTLVSISIFCDCYYSLLKLRPCPVSWLLGGPLLWSACTSLLPSFLWDSLSHGFVVCVNFMACLFTVNVFWWIALNFKSNIWNFFKVFPYPDYHGSRLPCSPFLKLYYFALHIYIPI